MTIRGRSRAWLAASLKIIAVTASAMTKRHADRIGADIHRQPVRKWSCSRNSAHWAGVRDARTAARRRGSGDLTPDPGGWRETSSTRCLSGRHG